MAENSKNVNMSIISEQNEDISLNNQEIDQI